MRLQHFVKEAFCAYRFQGIPNEVAEIKTKLEALKYLVVTCYKEGQPPTEDDMNDFKLLNQGDELFKEAEMIFQDRANRKPKLKVLN